VPDLPALTGEAAAEPGPRAPLPPRRAGAALRGFARNLVETVAGGGRTLARSFLRLLGAARELRRGAWRAAGRLAGEALLTLVLTPLDAALLLAGATVSLVQTLAGIEPPGRPLAPAEIELLRTLFGEAIDYRAVRVKEGAAGLLTLPRRPFVLADTIYVPPGVRLRPALLVHEATHVWQHQRRGTGYLSAALLAQHLGEGYDYLPALRRGRSWEALNPEQQAQLLEDAWRSGCVGCERPFAVAGEDWSEPLSAALDEVRAAGGRRA
jgi:hypothetical protein